MHTDELETGETGSTLGNTVKVEFVAFGNRACEGKVDTGATTSSLHATDIKIDQQSQQVSFVSDAISDNRVTLDLKGVQEVHSADAGGQHRPIVELDVTIDGHPLKGAAFNLNDRSNMDSRLLIGQNILKAGHFIIDPRKDGEKLPLSTDSLPGVKARNEAQVLKALEALAENNVSVNDLITYLQTAAVNRIKE